MIAKLLTHVSRTNNPAIVLYAEPRVRHDKHSKPMGFWYEVDGDWQRWCADEQPDWTAGRYLYTVALGSERMAQIATPAELDAFHAQWSTGEGRYSTPNWDAVAAEYDGVEIAPYLWERRLYGPFWYYGWDCASGVIWRPCGAVVTLLRQIEGG